MELDKPNDFTSSATFVGLLNAVKRVRISMCLERKSFNSSLSLLMRITLRSTRCELYTKRIAKKEMNKTMFHDVAKIFLGASCVE